jgi:hypothetical protein
MNTISIADKLCMWMLQQQNVKRDAIEKKITAQAPAPAPAQAQAPAPLQAAIAVTDSTDSV